MPHLLTILVALFLCSAPLHAQVLKSLMFNSTNGQVVANTGTNTLTFTNDVRFGNGDLTNSGQQLSGSGISLSFEDGNLVGNLYMDGAILFGNATNSSETRANLGLSTNLNTLWTATNASNARSAVGLGVTWLTNTNVTNFRTAIGLGENSAPTFNSIKVGITNALTFESTIEDDGINWFFNRGTNLPEPVITLGYLTNSILSFLPIVFQSNSHAATTRTNLSLGLPALTNTSNVTMMRALSGSTNTNHPYSGTVALTNTNAVLTFSNGILQSVQ